MWCFKSIKNLFISSKNRILTTGAVEKYYQSPHFAKAHELVKNGMIEKKQAMEQMQVILETLDAAVIGARRQYLSKSKGKGNLSSRKKYLEQCLIQLMKMEEQYNRLSKQYNDLVKKDELFTRSKQDAKDLKDSLEMQQCLEKSGMDPEMMMKVANKTYEIESQMNETTNMMNDRQKIISEMSESSNTDNASSAFEQRMKDLMSPMNDEEHSISNIQTVIASSSSSTSDESVVEFDTEQECDEDDERIIHMPNNNLFS